MAKKVSPRGPLILYAVLTFVSLSVVPAGCHVPVVAVIVVVGKLTAVKAGAVVLGLASAFYTVEAAWYDMETKRLELEAVKNGERTTIVIRDLTDDQIATILEKGALELEFRDGTVQRVKVKVR